jgi:hypothetical protein
MTVAEAKARLLEYGHRPRGPKAAIRRDPVTAAALALVGGILISRMRPGGLLPLGLLFSKPVLSRVLPLAAQFAAGRAKAKAGGAKQAFRERGARPEPWDAVSAVREWAMGPRRRGEPPPGA